MKQFLIVLFVLLGFIAKGQSPVSVVTAPALEVKADMQLGALSMLQGSIKAIEDAEKKVEKIKEKADWINQLKSIQEFITLMETVACMVRDLNVDLSRYNNIIGSRASCYFDFHYQVNITKLRKSVDIINLVISDGFSMDRGERMDAYEVAYQNFVASQHDLHALQSLIRRKLNQHERNKRYKQSLTSLYGI